jgi:hypothetical protein
MKTSDSRILITHVGSLPRGERLTDLLIVLDPAANVMCELNIFFVTQPIFPSRTRLNVLMAASARFTRTHGHSLPSTMPSLVSWVIAAFVKMSAGSTGKRRRREAALSPSGS